MQSGAACGAEAAWAHRSTTGWVRPHPGASGAAPVACRRRHAGAHGLLVGWAEKHALKAQFSVPQCPERKPVEELEGGCCGAPQPAGGAFRFL